MDFELSDDQQALRDAAAALLDELAAPARVREVVDAGGGFDPALWAAMGEQGWVGVELDEARGGLGLGAVETAVLCEQIGRHVAPAPFLSTALCLGVLARASAAGVHAADEPLDALLSTGAIGTVAWLHGAPALRAHADGSSWALTGGTGPVLYAPSASVVVAVAADDDGAAGLYAVPLGGDAAARPPREPAMDRTRELGMLVFDGARGARLGGPAEVDALLDRGATGHAAEMLGAASAALDMAVAYAKDRVQFGRPIGSFQAVKHRLADMLVDVEGMRSSVFHAAWSIGAGDPGASIAASVAKSWCSEAGKRVMASALQVHGGIGFTWEHDLHLFLKRAQLDQLAFGSATFHQDRLAAMLRERVEAGQSVI